MAQTPALFEAADVEETLDEATFRVASFLRAMWEWFHPYADTTFVAELRGAVAGLHDNPTAGTERDRAYFQFQQRFWEMYVGCALLDQGVKLTPRADWEPAWGAAGPDLMALVDGRRVWVECVAPGPGTGPDGVPEIGDKPIEDVPVEGVKLRYLNALDAKRKQVAKHTQRGIVKAEDSFVVAINSRCIPFAFLTSEPPWIAAALYGLGNIAVTYNKSTKQWSEPFLTRRELVIKKNAESIDANLFMNGKATEVSGVLYSEVDAWNRKGDLASELMFMHNHMASAPVPDRWLPFSVSYSVKVSGNIGTLVRSDPEPLQPQPG